MRSRSGTLIGLSVALLTACSASVGQTPAATIHPSSLGEHGPGARNKAPAPSVPPPVLPTPITPQPLVPADAVVDAPYIANELGAVETAIRVPTTRPSDFPTLGRWQQIAYHLLARHPEWLPSVLNALPPNLRPVIQANITAAQQIGTLNGSVPRIPQWRIIAPPPPDTLLGYYREAQQAYGIAWQYLAAINLIETNMGRIQGLSSAGAQGPMQFMPATWATYGRGDVNNPRDAILAAGRYLQAAGAARDMNRAIYAYNNSALYVRAVTLYAQQMFDNAQAFLGYYNWQVYVPTTNGEVLLPEGFSG